MKFRRGSIKDLANLKRLGIKSWSQFQRDLTVKNWKELERSLNEERTYLELLDKSFCLVCENENNEIIGMSFLVPSGNPTKIYDKDWSYIRFVTVDPNFEGLGIGKQLTKRCIEHAKKSKEKVIALHTSEMMSNARHIYENFGFKIERELEPRFGKKYWLYKLEL